MLPSYYAIRLAALASRKELVDLEKWLSYNLNTYKDIFFEVISGWPCIYCILTYTKNLLRLSSKNNHENARFWYILYTPSIPK